MRTTRIALHGIGMCLLTLSALLHPGAAAGGISPAAVPAQRDDAAWMSRDQWLARQVEHKAAVAAGPVDVVLLGDSITEGWGGTGWRLDDGSNVAARRWLAGRRAVNLGISGDRTEHLLWRVENGVLDGARPRLIVLQIGINNLSGAAPGNQAEDVLEGMRAILGKLRATAPNAKVLLLGCFPGGYAPDSPLRKQVNRLHALLAAAADRRSVFYRDFRSLFLCPDGTINHRLVAADDMHLLEPGYDAWGAALDAAFRTIVEYATQEVQPEWMKQAAQVTPSPRQVAFQEMEFAVRIALPAEYSGPGGFNPPGLDPRQWVAAAKAGGVKLLVMPVALAGDGGLCLWPSRYTTNSVLSSPWQEGRGDLLREVTEVCRAEKLPVGLVGNTGNSLGGGANERRRSVIPTEPTALLSEPERGRAVLAGKPTLEPIVDDMNRCSLNQLFELLTEYGPIASYSLDAAVLKEGQKLDRDSHVALIRQLRPDAVILDAVDARGDFLDSEALQGPVWSVLPAEFAAPGPDGLVTHRKALGEVAQPAGGGRWAWCPTLVSCPCACGAKHGVGEPCSTTPFESLRDAWFGTVGNNASLLLELRPDGQGRIPDSQVAWLDRFGRYVRETFARNLGAGGVAKATTEEAGFPASGISDADAATFWKASNGVTSAAIQLKLPQDGAFNIVELREQISGGQRIEDFLVEAWTDVGWSAIARGTTVGHRRLLRVPVTTAGAVRVLILRSREAPALAGIGLFREAIPPAAPRIVRSKSGEVRIEDSPPGTEVRYTLNETDVCPTSLVYKAAFPLPHGGLVRARSFLPGTGTKSEEALAFFGPSKSKWKVVSVSSEQADTEPAANAVDDDPGTIWRSRYKPAETSSPPYELTIDLGESMKIAALVYTPRRDGDQTGTVLQYEVLVSADAKSWSTAAAGEFPYMVSNPTEQTVRFSRAKTARYLKFRGLSEIHGQPGISAAELGILVKE